MQALIQGLHAEFEGLVGTRSMDPESSSGQASEPASAIQDPEQIAALKARSALNRGVEVIPRWIFRLDQFNLPGTSPSLELLLAFNRCLDVIVHFVIDQPRYPVAGSEASFHTLPVPPYTLFQRAGDANVQRSVPAAGQDVHVSRTRHGSM